MNKRRVLSSREQELTSRLMQLYEQLYLIRDALGELHEDFEDDEDVLFEELGAATVRLAIAHEDLENDVARITMDNINFQIANAMLESSVEKRQKALETLAAPPVGHAKELDAALKFLLTTPGIKVAFDPGTNNLVYTMDSTVLSEAFQAGIEMYNLEHLSNMKF